MNDKDTDLLPCPFCGGEAAFGTIRYSSEMVREQEWTQDVFHTVGCISCGSSTQKITGHKTQDGAAESWNARVDPALDRLKAENERLTDALIDIYNRIGVTDCSTYRRARIVADYAEYRAWIRSRIKEALASLEGGENEDESK